ncbi:MAG: DUF5763 domain-containing protein [Bacteroidales bacterium]|nr:DUF5763 domain-containing protein [Bacteroidales bacterium]
MKQLLSLIVMLIISTAAIEATAAPRCRAITKKGTQCKRKARHKGYCKQHWIIINTPKAKLCKARTNRGIQCSRKRQAGSDYCWQHARKYAASSQR